MSPSFVLSALLIGLFFPSFLCMVGSLPSFLSSLPVHPRIFFPPAYWSARIWAFPTLSLFWLLPSPCSLLIGPSPSQPAPVSRPHPPVRISQGGGRERYPSKSDGQGKTPVSLSRSDLPVAVTATRRHPHPKGSLLGAPVSAMKRLGPARRRLCSAHVPIIPIRCPTPR